MTRPIPTPKQIRDLMEDLLGRSVKVSPADPLRNADVHRSLVAVYVDDSLGLAAIAGMGFSLAVYSAAALGLVPPGGAHDFVEGQQMPPSLVENAKEVCNILGSVLNKEGLPHLRLYQTYLPGEALPADATGHLLALGRRLDLTVEVAGYGAGKLSISLIG